MVSYKKSVPLSLHFRAAEWEEESNVDGYAECAHKYENTAALEKLKTSVDRDEVHVYFKNSKFISFIYFFDLTVYQYFFVLEEMINSKLNG